MPESQLDLFGEKPTRVANPMPKHVVDKFDGETYDKAKDGERLTSLMGRVSSLMSDGQWRTLAQIVTACGGTEASVSARLRDLRKDKFRKRYPNEDVVRRRVENGNGLHEYKVVT
jgi:hypothetical protein